MKKYDFTAPVSRKKKTSRLARTYVVPKRLPSTWLEGVTKRLYISIPGAM